MRADRCRCVICACPQVVFAGTNGCRGVWCALKRHMRESPDQRFGKRLRLERERRRITLDSIASNTKIGIALLRGLERDDVSRWPSGIFRRSFIREYAAAIGLDPDETAREFLERFPD